MFESYYILKKKNENTLVKEIKLCHLCKKELVNRKCPNDDCLSHRLTRKEVVKKSIKIVTVDIAAQLDVILGEYYSLIVKHKRKQKYNILSSE